MLSCQKDQKLQELDSRQSTASIEVKPTLVEAQSPSGFGKLPYTTSGPHILTNTGDIRILPFHFYYLIDIYIFSSAK